MGMTRKLMSVTTLGLVDFRSDKERTAAYTAAAKREAKKQTRLMKEAARESRRAAAPTHHPTPVPFAAPVPAQPVGAQRPASCTPGCPERRPHRHTLDQVNTFWTWPA